MSGWGNKKKGRHRWAAKPEMMMADKYKLLVWVIGGLLGFSGPVWAGQDGHSPGAPPWHKLPPQERRLLHEHADRWPQYSPEVKRRLHNNANRFLNMSPQERQTVRDRGARRFQQLSPQKKRQACGRYYREQGRIPPFCRRFQNGRGH